MFEDRLGEYVQSRNMQFLSFSFNNTYDITRFSFTTMKSDIDIINKFINIFKNKDNDESTGEILNHFFTNIGILHKSNSTLAVAVNNFLNIVNVNDIQLKDKNGLSIMKISIMLKNYFDTLKKIKIDVIDIFDVLLEKIQNFDDPELFAFACSTNNLEIVQKLAINCNNPKNIVNGVDIMTKLRPITIAIKNTNIEIVQLLLDLYVNLNIVDSNGLYPVFYILELLLSNVLLNEHSRDNCSNIFKIIIQKDCANLKNQYGESILEVLCEVEQYNLISALFDEKYDFTNSPNINSSFCKLLQNKSVPLDILEKFYPYIDINHVYIYGKTPLIYAISNERDDIVQSLFSNINSKILFNNDTFGSNVLFYALENKCSYLVIDYLVENYSTEEISQIVNNTNKKGNTALINAVKNKVSDSIILYYLSKFSDHIDINTKDANNKSVLIYSVLNNNFNLFKFLLKNKDIDVNCYINDDNDTILMYLIEEVQNSNYLQYIFLLLKHPKINVNIQNKSKQTSLLLMLDIIYDNKVITYDKDSYYSEQMSSFPECYLESTLDPKIPFGLINLNSKKKNNNSNYDLIINLLVGRNDIDLNIYDNFGTPLMYSCLNSDINMFNLVLNSKNYNINC